MFQGSIVALVTPMQPNGVIDIESLRNLVEWHISERTDGIVVLGSTGENPTIDHAERNLVIQQVLEQSQGRVPIMAGTGTNSTQSTIQLTREAMELGVDACLIVVPYYNRPTQEGLYQHFKAVAEAVPVPQILYNVPSRTGCDLKPTTLAHLASIPNIIGLKDATGDLSRLRETLSLVADNHLDLYSGDDPTATEFMLAGGKGNISITANIIPKTMHLLAQVAVSKSTERARALDAPLANLHKQMCIESNPIPVKWALNQMGMIPSGIRLPLLPLSESCHFMVEEAMREAGIDI